MAENETSPVPAQASLPKKCCGNCRHAVFVLQAPNLRDCCYDPPRLFMAQGSGGRPVFVTEFPKMRPEQRCGKHEKISGIG